jgi:adenosylmethionine-8-amino-7-oxononanoate aminotransferase
MQFTLHRKPGIPAWLCPIRGCAGCGNQAARMRPVECRTRIGLASGRNVAMPDHPIRGQARVGPAQRRDHAGERMILRRIVGKRVGALEFDADGKVVAGLTTGEARPSGMPGAFSEPDVLGDRTVAPDDQVRGHTRLRNLSEVRMRIDRQTVGKQAVYPRSAELAGRQTDPVHDDQIRLHVGRPCIAIRRSKLRDIAQESARKVNLQIRPLVNNCDHSICDNPPPMNAHDQRLGRSAALAARDLRVLWHPCTQMKDHETLPPIAIKRGEGAWLEDHDGKRYLDAVSSWWVNLFGHANPRINAALREQLNQLEHVIFAGFTHEPAVRLAEQLVSLTPPGLTRCFFADNGSAAVEVAIKMSFHYWRNRGRPRKTRFITLANSYHGETLGALAVGNVELYKSLYKPLLMEVLTAPSPDCYFREAGESWEQHSLRQFDHMERMLAAHAEEVAAVIVEPLVQCAGGMRMYHPAYLARLREACNRHGVHLIADEIAVGFGRTGSLFACEQAAISPDFLCLSKGLTGGYLPLSAVLTTDEVYAAFYDDYANLTAFLHSHSYTGNPLACTAALATLDIFATDDIIERNRAKAAYLGGRARALADHQHVAEVRQCGMIVAIEIAKDKRNREPYPWAERRGRRIHRYSLDQGVLLRPIGDVVYFMPPYTVNEAEMDLMVRVAAEGIELATCD